MPEEYRNAVGLTEQNAIRVGDAAIFWLVFLSRPVSADVGHVAIGRFIPAQQPVAQITERRASSRDTCIWEMPSRSPISAWVRLP